MGIPKNNFPTMDYNNIEVSLFKNKSDKNPTRVKLLDILHTDRYKDIVETIRNEPDKAKRDKLKSNLPAFTPSAICEGGHSSSNVKEPTGLLFVDFDKKDNEGVENFSDLPTLARAIPNILYFGKSVRGEGFHAFMPIAEPERQREYFDSVYKAFKKKGLIIDKATSDITRLCYVSYDPEGWINPQAEPLELDEVLEGQEETLGGTLEPDQSITDIFQTYIEVARLIERAEGRKEARFREISQHSKNAEPTNANPDCKDIADFAEPYEEWLGVSFAFALSFGEEMGRPLYHAYSQLSAKYESSETDRQFSIACRSTLQKLSSGTPRKGLMAIGSFFKLCHDYGLRSSTIEEDFSNLDLSSFRGEEDNKLSADDEDL